MSEHETVPAGGRRASRPEAEAADGAEHPADHGEIDERYRGATEIARGGMGRVLVATDSVLGRTVAVKEALATDEETLRRFARETRITARLEHPSIVPVYDAGVTTDGSPFYVMRKVSGRPLDQLVMAATTLDRRLALLPHVLAAAQAVAHAHERGVLHRDLKPTNILVGVLGETVVIDWGLAKVMDEPDDPVGARVDPMPSAADTLHTRIGTVFGTPGFMAPEQVRGEVVDARGDVYALGATLYYVLAQRPPHAGSTGEAMMDAAMAGPPTPVGTLAPGTPRELAAIVEKALAYSDLERYADAGAFAADVSRFLTGQLVASHDYSAGERVRRFVRRNRVAVIVGGLAAIVLGVMLAISIRSVLASRDRADAQARLATRRQGDAVAAEQRALDRADQLLLTQARTLVATDPTAAIGLLKQLAATPDRWRQHWRVARAITADARASGVAFEIPGVSEPFHLELSPDGMRLVATSRDGTILLVDLATRRSRILDHRATVHVAYFVGNDRVMMLDDQRTQFIDVDLASGAVRQTERAGRVGDVVTCDRALFYVDHERHLVRVADADGTHQTLAGEPVDALAVSTDCHTVLVQSDHRLLRLDVDAAGTTVPTVLATGEIGPLDWDSTSQTGWAAVDGRIGSFPVSGPARYTTVDGGISALRAHGGRAYAVTSFGLFQQVRATWTQVRMNHMDMSSGLPKTRSGFTVALLENHIALMKGNFLGYVQVPSLALGRVAATEAGRYLVGAVPGHVLVWDVEAIIPPRIEIAGATNVEVVTDERIIFARDEGWFLRDLATGTETPVPLDLPPVAVHFDARKDTVVAYSRIVADAGMICRHGVATPMGEDATFALIGNADQVLVATRRGAVVEIAPDGRRVTLQARPSAIESIAQRGPWTGALWVDGTLWRRNAATGRDEVVMLEAAAQERTIQIVLEPDGSITAPTGSKIVVWTPGGTVPVIAALPLAITRNASTRSLLLATTADGATYQVDRDAPHRVAQWFASSTNIDFTAAYGADVAVYEALDSIPQIQDLLTRSHWSLGNRDLMAPMAQTSITASGRFLVASELGRHPAALVYRIDLPQTAEATTAWLDELTNAVIGDPTAATVAWPQPSGQVLQPGPP